MSTHTLTGLPSVPALTLLVAAGFFVAGTSVRIDEAAARAASSRPTSARPTSAGATSAGAASTRAASTPALTPSSMGVGDEPVEACPILSAASLTLTAAPERLRLRPWLRYGHLGVDRRDVAPPQPPPPTSPRIFLRGAPPLLRLAVAAGRRSAPTTAPPAVAS